MAAYSPWRVSKVAYRAAVVHLAQCIRAVTDAGVHPEVTVAAVEHLSTLR